MKRLFAVGLVLAMLAGCGPEPRRTAADIAASGATLTLDARDPVMARVDGTVIRRSDVEREAASQVEGSETAPAAPGTDAFAAVLNDLIDQRLLAMEARRRGLDQSEEAQRRLALAQERILGNVLVETALADAVNEETIERIYQEQVQLIPLGEEVRARHILVDTREEAEAIKALVDAGGDFSALAVRMSLDPATRLQGGDLGYFSREGVLPAFGAVAFNTGEGETSEPFQTEFGWHILQVVDRRREPPPSLETLRPNIVRFYTFDQLESLIDGLRQQAVIERIPLPDAALTLAPASGDVTGAAGDPDGPAAQTGEPPADPPAAPAADPG
ncbi:peptidylprolyl isomerase [uncultured Maricaulis sp.]|uniref:peptidylprolyl isomerase n=1 Tax=uncultured Maricaulis sp. TaxID=174710 RepID=UPI0030D85E7B|tara:strand:+ start:333572 stop:334561 length:990 start_codon:yes stop_codon:yes gene_type:complete